MKTTKQPLELSDVTLGSEIEDMITGLRGICVSKTEWLNGCNRIGIQPRGVKDGKPADPYHIDVQQVKILKAAPSQDHPPGGGPMPDPKR